jgi:hypothetical protein
MSDTPRTDGMTFVAQIGMMPPYDTVSAEFARQLERELNAAKAELAELKKVIRKVYYETETCADGAPDATDHDKLCNEVSSQLEPFIR